MDPVYYQLFREVDDMMKEFQGRHAILTGASKGLGVHIARRLAREGINHALAARSAVALEEICKEAQRLGVKAVSIPTDLADPTQLEALPVKAERKLGPPDILVNNAGIELTEHYEKYPRQKIQEILNVNLLARFAPNLLTNP